MRLYIRDTFGFEGDPREMSAEEETRGKAIVEELSGTHPGLSIEKALWSIDQRMQLWEDGVIKMGECFFAIKEHETQKRYMDALKRAGRKIKISEELADAYILAYKEERQNG
jgi:hypothetical protein